MIRRVNIPVFLGGLSILTLAALFANVPDTDSLDMTVWLFYAGLVALMLNLGTMLNEGVVSPASTAALMAYLTLGEENGIAGVLWCVIVGTLVGNLVWIVRSLPTHQTRRQYARVIRRITVDIAQMTLSLVIGNWFYRSFNGSLPLDHLGNADVGPLIALIVSYFLIYLGILFIEAYIIFQQTPLSVVKNWQGGIEMILLPLPFAIVGAVAYHGLSQLAFVILIGGLLIVVTGVNTLSRAQSRHHQQLFELSALSEVSRAMRANLDLNALLDVVYEQVTGLLDVGNFTVTLYDANRNTLYFPFNIRDRHPAPLDPRDFENGLIEYVIESKEGLLIPDQVPRRAKSLGLTPPMMPIYSWLGVPLLAVDRVLGCMVVYASQPRRRFVQSDLRLLNTIAAQAGIAIDNVQLYGQARDRAVQLATLNNVATILSGTLDVDQILDLVGSSAVAIASCQAVALYLWWDKTNPSLSLARYNGLSETYVANPPRPLLMDVTDLYRRRQPLLVTDSHIDQRTSEVRATMDREYKRAWAEFLLRKGDALTGIIVFYYNEPHHFDIEEIELLRNFTNQAALAITNARMYTQTDEALDRRIDQLSALADISRELTSTLNLQGLFQLVLDRAIEATQSRTGMLWLRSADKADEPRLVAQRGFSTDQTIDQIITLAGPTIHTYRTGYPTLVPDVREEQQPIVLINETTRALLNVPIMRGEDVLGVIALGSDTPSDYNPDDLTFVTQLATQARIAIDNARLFRDIEEARDRLQVILDSMREGIILISEEGQIALANPRVKRLLGLDPDAIMGVPLALLVENPDLAVAERLGFLPASLLSLIKNLDAGRWDESSRDGDRITFQVTAPKRRFIDRTNAPVRDENGRVIGLLMVFVDVTEERELARAREDLSNMIVHDLRGPLTAVTTSLKLINEFASTDDRLGKAIRQTTEASSRAVRKLLNLVDSLLDISKLESGVIAIECEPTDLNPLSAAVLSEMAPLANELAVSLISTIPEGLPLLDVDAEKIERVLLNLVDNAIKFTPSQGSVTITAYAPGTMGAEDNFIRAEVRDTGPGVPDEHKERLFDRFAQLDGQRGRRRGTGLGLAFCRLAIEAHGGQIWIEDNPQGGAIFAFTLPILSMPST